MFQAGGLVVILVEIFRKNFLASIVPVIVNAVLNEHHLVTDIVAFVAKGDFPRSRLGEKQRGKILASWVTRKMRTIAQFGIRDPDGGGSELTEVAEEVAQAQRHSSMMGTPGAASLKGPSSLRKVTSAAAFPEPNALAPVPPNQMGVLPVSQQTPQHLPLSQQSDQTYGMPHLPSGIAEMPQHEQLAEIPGSREPVFNSEDIATPTAEQQRSSVYTQVHSLGPGMQEYSPVEMTGVFGSSGPNSGDASRRQSLVPENSSPNPSQLKGAVPLGSVQEHDDAAFAAATTAGSSRTPGPPPQPSYSSKPFMMDDDDDDATRPRTPDIGIVSCQLGTSGLRIANRVSVESGEWPQEALMHMSMQSPPR